MAGHGWRTVGVTVYEGASSSCVLNCLAVPGRNKHRFPDLLILNKKSAGPDLIKHFDGIVERCARVCGYIGSKVHFWAQLSKPRPPVRSVLCPIPCESVSSLRSTASRTATRATT
jgi:hypothetical protein